LCPEVVGCTLGDGRGSTRLVEEEGTARWAEYDEAADTDASVALLSRREKPKDDAGERVYVEEGEHIDASLSEASKLRSKALPNVVSMHVRQDQLLAYSSSEEFGSSNTILRFGWRVKDGKVSKARALY
jgi:hypothetical protein